MDFHLNAVGGSFQANFEPTVSLKLRRYFAISLVAFPLVQFKAEQSIDTCLKL